jgi:hypothetical protein
MLHSCGDGSLSYAYDPPTRGNRVFGHSEQVDSCARISPTYHTPTRILLIKKPQVRGVITRSRGSDKPTCYQRECAS